MLPFLGDHPQSNTHSTLIEQGKKPCEHLLIDLIQHQRFEAGFKPLVPPKSQIYSVGGVGVGWFGSIIP